MLVRVVLTTFVQRRKDTLILFTCKLSVDIIQPLACKVYLADVLKTFFF